jgi:hypothetical protein
MPGGGQHLSRSVSTRTRMLGEDDRRDHRDVIVPGMANAPMPQLTAVTG